MNMKRRWIEEMTSPEVEQYLQSPQTTALLPAGSLEMHGPHLPLGTDTLTAGAFCVKLAEANDALILPAVVYTWTGSTDGFSGTISLDPSQATETVEAIALRCLRMGFRRFVIVSTHHGNNAPLELLARRFYEKYTYPILYVDMYRPFSEDARTLFEGQWRAGKEVSIFLAALSILGREDMYSAEQVAYESKSSPAPLPIAGMEHTSVGYRMQSLEQHVQPTKFVSKEKGKDFINLQIQYLQNKLTSFDAYLNTHTSLK